VLNHVGYRWAAVAFILLIMVTAGCTTTAPVKIPGSIAPPPEIALAEGWWFARFQLQWPEEEPVNWHWDLLIAHKIIAPELEKARGISPPGSPGPGRSSVQLYFLCFRANSLSDF